MQKSTTDHEKFIFSKNEKTSNEIWILGGLYWNYERKDFFAEDRQRECQRNCPKRKLYIIGTGMKSSTRKQWIAFFGILCNIGITERNLYHYGEENERNTTEKENNVIKEKEIKKIRKRCYGDFL